MAEQRYEAVRAVIAGGETVTSVAARFGVARKTVHVWLVKYEAGGLDGLADGSHRPRSCPHQMPAAVEVALVELRLAHPSWGPRRLSFELGKRGVEPLLYGLDVCTSVVPQQRFNPRLDDRTSTRLHHEPRRALAGPTGSTQ